MAFYVTTYSYGNTKGLKLSIHHVHTINSHNRVAQCLIKTSTTNMSPQARL